MTNVGLLGPRLKGINSWSALGRGHLSVACWDLYWRIGTEECQSWWQASRGQGDQIASPRPLWHLLWLLQTQQRRLRTFALSCSISFPSKLHWPTGSPGGRQELAVARFSSVALCALCGSLTWQASCSPKEPIGQANGNRPHCRDTDPMWVRPKLKLMNAGPRCCRNPLGMAPGSTLFYSIPPHLGISIFTILTPKFPWPFNAFGGTWNSDHYIQDSQWCWNDETI